MELLEVRRERDAALTELEDRESTLEQLRKQLTTQETNFMIELHSLQSQLETRTQELQKERETCRDLRDELGQLSQVVSLLSSFFHLLKLFLFL